jgi:hypothetical protein
MGASARNSSLAVTAAILFHALLLTQNLVSEEQQVLAERSLTVSLFEEYVEPPKPDRIIEDQAVTETEPAVPRPKVIPPPFEKFIVATKPGNEPEPRVEVQTSPHSTSFKNWLQSETEGFTAQNPNAVYDFDQTFEAPPPPVDNSEEFSANNRQNIPRGSGVFILENDGKITCGLKIDSLLSGVNSSSYVYKDCTPKAKFDLQLNQPNNGWADR